MTNAVADTSAFIARESAPAGGLPQQIAVSVMAAADPELEVLRGRDGTTRATLLATLAQVRSTYPLLAIDEAVATHFARLVAGGTTGGTEDPPPRHWIAATALRHGAAVLTQDADFTYFTFVEVIRV